MDRYLLIIEDDAGVREMLCAVLEDAGYRVATAEHGQEALSYLLANPPPFVILLDLMMPIMDGRQFRREQLAIPHLAKIPVAVLSADLQLDKGEEMRGTVALKKPLDLDRLIEIVQRHGSPPP